MKTIRRGNAIVLHMAAEDFADPPRVEAAFDEVVGLLRLRNVVIDMQAATRLTSIGISTIAAGADVARSRQARCALAGVRPEVRRLLEQVGVVSAGQPPHPYQMVVAEDVEGALKLLQADEGPDPQKPASLAGE